MTAKTAANRNVLPRPFLKWVGGKRQLLPELLKRIDAAGEFGRYHEPFIGGGALFFEMYRLGRLGRKQAYLSDNNPRLIETYEVVRDSTDDLIRLLKQHKAKNEHDYYYEVRANVPKDKIARAARIIYMNKTCYNGLYRENSKGLFNTPYGRYKNPQICDEENLHACAEALRRTRIDARHFDTVTKVAKEGDLVYFDPPYHPVSETASFTSYAKDGFGIDEQMKLAELCKTLDSDGVKFILSNSSTDIVKKLYKHKPFRIEVVNANRNINSKSEKRGPVEEVLVTNS